MGTSALKFAFEEATPTVSLRRPVVVGQTHRLKLDSSFATPSDTYRSEIRARVEKGETIRAELVLRAKSLLEIAREESVQIHAESWSDFGSFLKSEALASRPALFLLNNGNLRAVWRGQGTTQVGLQFLGAGMIQYALIARDKQTFSAGRARVAQIALQLKAHRLDKLVFA